MSQTAAQNGCSTESSPSDTKLQVLLDKIVEKLAFLQNGELVIKYRHGKCQQITRTESELFD